MDTELKPGDRVRIKSGPLASFPGTVESVSEEGLLVRVVVEIFGRATPLDLQYCDVEKFEGPLPPLSSDN
jgi:transcriptional antiterminator NusG